jgi:hypothetical protein
MPVNKAVNEKAQLEKALEEEQEKSIQANYSDKFSAFCCKPTFE